MNIWEKVVDQLKHELKPTEFITWIKPLQGSISDGTLNIYAPNKFIVQHVSDRYLNKIRLLASNSGIPDLLVKLTVGDVKSESRASLEPAVFSRKSTTQNEKSKFLSNLDPKYTFDNFVQGKSNQFAYSASLKVSEQLGASTFNPLFIYGPTALGKSHLMHAIGNAVLLQNPGAKVLYRRSEAFVNDFVTAIRNKVINDFNKLYRSLDVLLIDDIHFFANKTASQEEFFHTFNSLLEGSRQIVLASDRFPKEIEDVDDRLKSRLAWGLAIQVEPPELETRVAILHKKAEINKIILPRAEAFFIAQQIQTNVRELEGALNKVIATARFKGVPIDMDLVRDSLKDVIAVRAKLISIDNIQKVVAEYFHIPVRELTGKRKSRDVVRPRQIAMSLAKEMTSLSLSAIGDAFDGRDHTTVLHACKNVKELRSSDARFEEDYLCIQRTLQS